MRNKDFKRCRAFFAALVFVLTSVPTTSAFADGPLPGGFTTTPVFAMENAETGGEQNAVTAPNSSAVTAPATYTLTIEPPEFGAEIPTGTTGMAGPHVSGAQIDIAVKVRDGYTFTGWTSDNEGVFADADALSTIFTMPSNHVTIKPTVASKPQVGNASAPDATGGVTVPVAVKAAVGANNTATLDKQDTETMLREAVGKATRAIAGTTGATRATIAVRIAAPRAETLVAPLNRTALETVAVVEKANALEFAFTSSAGAIRLDSFALDKIRNEANERDVVLVLGKNSAAARTLTGAALALVAIGVPVFDASVYAITAQNDLVPLITENLPGDGPIKISVPYPGQVTSGKKLVVRYLNAKNGSVSTADAAPTLAGGFLTFRAAHLSLFAVEETPLTPSPGGGPGGLGGDSGATPAAPKTEEPKDEKKTGGTETSWADNPFTDVRPADWFYGDVKYVVKNGLMSGVSAASFDPKSPMTRGMIVTVLGRLHGADVRAYTTCSFDDVETGQYYTAYVEWAKENGIVNGVGGNLFAPNANVSRQDFAVILLRYADFAKKQFPAARQFGAFADGADIADYAKNAVRTLYNGGVINGVGADAINPKGSVTRAEVAAMLHRFAVTAQ